MRSSILGIHFIPTDSSPSPANTSPSSRCPGGAAPRPAHRLAGSRTVGPVHQVQYDRRASGEPHRGVDSQLDGPDSDRRGRPGPQMAAASSTTTAPALDNRSGHPGHLRSRPLGRHIPPQPPHQARSRHELQDGRLRAESPLRRGPEGKPGQRASAQNGGYCCSVASTIVTERD
jgi:hypothetical protein